MGIAGIALIIVGAVLTVFGFKQDPTDWLLAGGGIFTAIIGLVLIAIRLNLPQIIGDIVEGFFDALT